MPSAEMAGGAVGRPGRRADAPGVSGLSPSGGRRIAARERGPETSPVQSSDEPTDRESSGDTRLRRAVSGKLLFLFILGDVLGAGIYALFGVIAGKVGGAVGEIGRAHV